MQQMAWGGYARGDAARLHSVLTQYTSSASSQHQEPPFYSSLPLPLLLSFTFSLSVSLSACLHVCVSLCLCLSLCLSPSPIRSHRPPLPASPLIPPSATDPLRSSAIPPLSPINNSRLVS